MTIKYYDERPIIFSTKMVRALLDDRKTQTRRVIKPQPIDKVDGDYILPDDAPQTWRKSDHLLQVCPYGKPGDRLWVRETWKPILPSESGAWTIHFKTGDPIERYSICGYPASFKDEIEVRSKIEKLLREKGCPFDEVTGEFRHVKEYMPWKSSIHMPEAVSRIQLKVTTINIEQLQDISTGDIMAEGVVLDPESNTTNKRRAARDRFKELWDSINAGRDQGQFSWEANPWVWVVEFEVEYFEKEDGIFHDTD